MIVRALESGVVFTLAGIAYTIHAVLWRCWLRHFCVRLFGFLERLRDR